MIAGTKVTRGREKAHIYSGTNNAIDSYKIPKSLLKGDTFSFIRTRVSSRVSVTSDTSHANNAKESKEKELKTEN